MAQKDMIAGPDAVPMRIGVWIAGHMPRVMAMLMVMRMAVPMIVNVMMVVDVRHGGSLARINPGGYALGACQGARQVGGGEFM